MAWRDIPSEESTRAEQRRLKRVADDEAWRRDDAIGNYMMSLVVTASLIGLGTQLDGLVPVLIMSVPVSFVTYIAVSSLIHERVRGDHARRKYINDDSSEEVD